MDTDDTDAASGPEVRKKVAHGETVGITVNWDEPRQGRQNLHRETHETRQIRENFRFNRKSAIVNRKSRRPAGWHRPLGPAPKILRVGETSSGVR